MTPESLMNNPRFQQFLDMIQAEMDRRRPDLVHRTAALDAERNTLMGKCAGWMESLSVPHLPHAVRSDLVRQYDAAKQRITQIDGDRSRLAIEQEEWQQVVEPRAVAEALANLHDVLEQDNCSAGNIHLAHHIEGIYCDDVGNVTIRTCKLGALAGAVEVFREAVDATDFQAGVEQKPIYRSRRLTYRDIQGTVESLDEADALNDFAIDPGRFDGLGPEWFQEDVFHVPERLSWVEAHAVEIAQFRLRTHLSIAKVALEFDVSDPTIKAALKIAKEQHGIDATGREVSKPSRKHWAKEHAQEVAEFLNRPGVMVKDAIEHFRKDEGTIRAARKFAAQAMPEGSDDSPARDRRKPPHRTGDAA